METKDAMIYTLVDSLDLSPQILQNTPRNLPEAYLEVFEEVGTLSEQEPQQCEQKTKQILYGLYNGQISCFILYFFRYDIFGYHLVFSSEYTVSWV